MIDHLNIIEMSNILTFGLPVVVSLYLVHNLFPIPLFFFDKYGAITLEQVKRVIDTHYNGLVAQSINKNKGKCLYKYLFWSINSDLQKFTAQITDKTLQWGFLLLYYLIHKVTEANIEAVCRTEKELHTIYLKDYDYNAIKLITEIKTLVKTIQANRVELRTLCIDIVKAFSD